FFPAIVNVDVVVLVFIIVLVFIFIVVIPIIIIVVVNEFIIVVDVEAVFIEVILFIFDHGGGLNITRCSRIDTIIRLRSLVGDAGCEMRQHRIGGERVGHCETHVRLLGDMGNDRFDRFI